MYLIKRESLGLDDRKIYMCYSNKREAAGSEYCLR